MWPFKKKPTIQKFPTTIKYKYRIVEFMEGQYRVERSSHIEPNWWAKMPLPFTYTSIKDAEKFIFNQQKIDRFVPTVIAEYS